MPFRPRQLLSSVHILMGTPHFRNRIDSRSSAAAAPHRSPFFQSPLHERSIKGFSGGRIYLETELAIRNQLSIRFDSSAARPALSTRASACELRRNLQQLSALFAIPQYAPRQTPSRLAMIPHLKRHHFFLCNWMCHRVHMCPSNSFNFDSLLESPARLTTSAAPREPETAANAPCFTGKFRTSAISA